MGKSQISSSREWPNQRSCCSVSPSFPSPTVAIMQWKHEVLSHTDGLKVLVWHGFSRETNHKELAKYDVVRKSPSPTSPQPFTYPTGFDHLLYLGKVSLVIQPEPPCIHSILAAFASKRLALNVIKPSSKRGRLCTKSSGKE